MTATARRMPAIGRPNRSATIVGGCVVAIVIYYFVLRWALGVVYPGVSASAGDLALQHVANGLSLGAMYALIALGYTMVYGILELINFAHGEVFMIGSFVSLVFLGFVMGQTGPVTDPIFLAILLIGALIVTMPVSGLLNVGIERLFYRPLRNAPRLAPLITAIGVSFILQNIAQVIAGSGNERYPQVFPIREAEWRITIQTISIPILNFVIFATAILLLIALQQFVGRTRLGRAMRATAQDREAAALMGVDANQTIALTFLIGGALAGAAGVAYGLYFGLIRHDIGFNAGLKAFTSAVLGGIGNITGAVLGGFIIGFVEVFASALGQAVWAQAIVFGVLTSVLIFRPSGILGQQIGERA